ncbi:HNH endonuclease [Anaeromyxobacter sp. Fw109-5]|nr:HNH endonuclease [Anaeromyxobacter sp. Fw109-5]
MNVALLTRFEAKRAPTSAARREHAPRERRQGTVCASGAPRGRRRGEAIRCAIEKHGKRKGAVLPQRQRKADRDPRPSAEPAAPTSTIPAIVRREVWKRDGGRCAWVAPDGRRCNSRWQLELDHIQPQALGGPSTVENLRVACKSHNMLHAEQTYGREHMDRFRRESVSERTGHAGTAPAAIQQGLYAT